MIKKIVFSKIYIKSKIENYKIIKKEEYISINNAYTWD